MAVLLRKVERQYLLTSQVSRYCLLALHGSLYKYNRYSNEEEKGKGAGFFIKSDIKCEDLSSDFTFHPLVTGSVHSCAISNSRRSYSPAAISTHWTLSTHCNLCPTSPGSYFHQSQVKSFEGEVPCPRTQHWNNVLRLIGEKHDFPENLATSRVWNRTASRDNSKAPSSNCFWGRFFKVVFIKISRDARSKMRWCVRFCPSVCSNPETLINSYFNAGPASRMLDQH